MIVGVLGDRLKVKVAAPPEDGKANQAVVDLISDWLDCDVELIAGHSRAEKLVRIRGLAKIGEGRLSLLK